MTRRVLIGIAMAGAAAVLAWVLFVQLPRRYRQSKAVTASPAAAVAAPAGRRINARLFYLTEDGMQLKQVDREVPYGDTAADQAREIAAAQLAPATAPLVSAVPAGTTLRAIFLTDRGQAYVDISKEAVLNHTGGTLDELLTVYTIVNALTVNLPAITSVQVLVDGKEVATLAGHMDLRRPLARNLTLVQ
jgi:spore germination protein GerM